jgi:hypothetical protein
MRIFRIIEPRLSATRIRTWHRRILDAIALLLLLLCMTIAGLVFLDRRDIPLIQKIFTAVWNGINLVSTLGDFTAFNDSQKPFMLFAMTATLLVGGYAISRLSGILNGNDVMVFKENKAMKRTLERMTGHVVVVGFYALGELVASRLREAGETVLVIVSDEDQAGKAAEYGYDVILGSNNEFDDALKHAQLDRAKALVVTTPDSDSNLAITLLARSLNAALPISTSGDNPSRKGLFESAGATNVVISGELIANALVGTVVEK